MLTLAARALGGLIVGVVAAHSAMAREPSLEICLEGTGPADVLRFACDRAISLPTTVGATRATILVRRAQLLFVTGRFDGALADVADAIATNPHSATARNLRGLLRHRLGNLETALGDFGYAATLNPYDAEPHGYRAAVLFQLNRRKAATAAAEKALSILPSHPLATLILGANAFVDEEYRRAAKHFRSVLESPGLNYPLAAFWYAAAVARDGGDAGAAFEPYGWWWDVGGWRQALADLFAGNAELEAVEKSIAAGNQPNSTRAWFFLSQWRHANGTEQAAYETLEKALVDAPPYLLETIVAKRLLERVGN